MTLAGNSSGPIALPPFQLSYRTHDHDGNILDARQRCLLQSRCLVGFDSENGCSDVALFLLAKMSLRGRTFAIQQEVCSAVQPWVWGQPRKFFPSAFDKWSCASVFDRNHFEKIPVPSCSQCKECEMRPTEMDEWPVFQCNAMVIWCRVCHRLFFFNFQPRFARGCSSRILPLSPTILSTEFEDSTTSSTAMGARTS